MQFNIGSFIFIPLVAVLIMPWASKFSRWAADVLGLLAGGALVIVAFSFVPLGPDVPMPVFKWLDLNLAMDGLSLLFIVTISTVSLLCLLYSINYIDHYGGRGKFYSLLLLMVAGMNGVVLVRDLFSLYLFLEVASIASYVLVAYNLKFDGIESAFKYLLLSVVATGFILIGIAIIYTSTGTLAFSALRDYLASGLEQRKALFLAAAALFFTGFGLKAAVMPFHAWLPDAHPSAPAPISAMLSGVVIKVAGIYALIRLFYYVYPAPAEIRQVFMVLGILSMVAGAVIAFYQDDFKRMLAYSSISQIGYILIGLALGNTLGIVGALFHVYNHALFKSLLFLNSGAVQFRTGTRSLSEMGGLAERMRVTSITSAFGSLAISGIPPFNGFFSKLFIIVAAVAAKQYAVAALLVFISIFTLGYFLVIQRKAFFGKLNMRWKDIKEVPLGMSLAMILLAAQCLLVGVFFNDIVKNLIEPAARILYGGK